MTVPQACPISIFEYADYRIFLKDYYTWAHAQDRKFSHRLIGTTVGSSSSGWFLDVLNSRQNLVGTQLVKLASLFKLDEKGADYLELLVQFNQAGSLEEKNRYYRKLMALRGPQAKIVGHDRFEFYSKWYYSAIRELLFFHDFTDDYSTLAKKLNPPIRVSEATEAIKLLAGLGFIRKDAQGRYRPLEHTIRKDATFKSLYTTNFMTVNMELGIAAMERIPKDERHISALTLSFSEPFISKAMTEIESLRKRLLAMMAEDPHPEKVYQMNLQFFPVTQ